MRVRRLASASLVLAALLAVGFLLGCGGGSGDSSGSNADADPEAVLATALGAEGDPIESGVLDLEFDLRSQSGDGVAATASISGPFESNGDDALPSVDFDVNAGATGEGKPLSFEGGLTLSPDGLYVGFGGSHYQVDDATFSVLQDAYARSANLQADQEETGSLSQFGIDPSTWLTDVTNEGVEDLDGTDVVHVSGTADVAQIIDDLGTVADQSGQAEKLDPSSLDQLESSIENASIDVYADADDDMLRKLDVHLDVADPTGGGTDSVSISVGIADPNTEQEITAPADARPLSDLISQFPDLASSLGGLDPAAASSGTTPPTGGSDAYYQCVAAAPTPADVTKCSKLLRR